MLNLQDWLDEHESPQNMQSNFMYVRSEDVQELVDQIRREKAEPVASVPQDVEALIYTHGNSALMRGAIIDVVPIDALTAWMAGHARGPVEFIDALRDLLAAVDYDQEMTGPRLRANEALAMLPSSKERTE